LDPTSTNALKLNLPKDWEGTLLKMRMSLLKFDEYIISQMAFLQLAGIAVPVQFLTQYILNN